MKALLTLLLLAGAPPVPSEGLPPSVTIYTDVDSAVWRAGLQRAFEDHWPDVRWNLVEAGRAGQDAPLQQDAWLLHVETKEADVLPENQVVLYVLKTPRGQSQAETTVGTSTEGSWLFPLGVCGALACGPCPACSPPGLAVSYAVGALILGGPGALGDALGGALATLLGACLLWPCLLIPPGFLIWPLEASKMLRPLNNHHKLHRTAASVLPQLVQEAFVEGRQPPPPADKDGPMPQVPSDVPGDRGGVQDQPPPPQQDEPTLSL